MEKFQWTQVSSEGPSARTHYSMVYNTDSKQVFLFGGFDGEKRSNDLWCWDGALWIEIKTNTRPVPRNAAAMAYDIRRKRIVLYGGYAARSMPLNDTWEFDGKDWIKMKSSPIEGRFGHDMVYDMAIGQCIVHGGFVADTIKSFKDGNRWVGKSVNETWTWNGQHWETLTDNKSPNRYYLSLAYNPKQNASYAFGGVNFTSKEEIHGLWRLKNGKWKSVSSTGPSPRVFSAFAAAGDRLFVLNGSSYQEEQTSFNDFWMFEKNKWIRLSIPGLPQTKELKMVYDQNRKVLVAFGGVNDKGELSGTTWELKIE